mmetsp:Transcript_12553/g.36986  ORF Transcript_12553/g.36986 Transcript_12553/m.36986 type:complete len:148 (+) Transcript_12553:70-513(+)
MPEDEGGWDVESLLPYTPPSWVEVRGSSRGSFRVQCEGVDSIAGLQWLVHERLMLQPNQGVRLSHWGRECRGEETFRSLSLQTGAKFEMVLLLQRAPDAQLARVRIACSALRTRQYAVDAATTVLQLKTLIESGAKAATTYLSGPPS